MRDISIIIPFHSGRFFLELCLGTLVKTVPEHVEIIVLMNNSDLSQIEWTPPWSNVKAVRVDKNLGHAGAVNAGVEAASRGRLIICDADAFFPYPWIEQIISLHTSIRNIGITGAKLVNPDTGRVIDFGMGLSKYNNAHPFMDRKADHPLVNNDRSVLMLCSACMCIDRDVFNILGGLDEDLHNFYTDNDICLKAIQRGYSNWVAGNSIVYHRGNSASTNRNPYKADVKAWYRGKHHRLMKPDMDRYFAENYAYLISSREIDDVFVYLDLSSVGDRSWHKEVIGQFFSLSTHYESYAPRKDEEKVELISRVDPAIMATSNPILYFVDRFISLQGNQLWKELRPNTRDVVVDRNGNMVFFDQINQE